MKTVATSLIDTRRWILRRDRVRLDSGAALGRLNDGNRGFAALLEDPLPHPRTTGWRAYSRSNSKIGIHDGKIAAARYNLSVIE
jgi:hypothetical protein